MTLISLSGFVGQVPAELVDPVAGEEGHSLSAMRDSIVGEGAFVSVC
jgi:hypothetical protein